MEHTKGEWTVGRELDADFHAKLITISTDYFRDGGFDFICYVNDTKEARANAQLIASAPDEDKCLRDFGLYVAVNYDTDNKPFYYIDQEWLDMRKRALAKAEGK